MAAVIGGVNLLWTKPLQEESLGDLEKRVARNVSSILKEEAYLDKVMDPASGSFFLEKMKEEILSEIKNGLINLQDKGGWLEALRSGELYSQVRSYREKIQNDVASKQISKIGANKFPASDALRNDLEFDLFEEKSFELNPTRASYLVELQNQNLL
jgi:methylmalonyl-CoA mutase